MTNSQKKKKTEILELWANLKEKIKKISFLNQNRELIKEALEIHLNQASSLTSEQLLSEQQFRLRIPNDWQITTLTEPTVPEYNSDGKVNQEWLEYFRHREWNAYLSQKEKNEKIVRECQELLRELGE